MNGKPLTGVVGITFALYAEQNGGAALWMETQNVQADANGHYSVLLGSTKPDGLPAELFATGQARWVGVQIEQQTEQPRTLLVSAPYALKAGDAETLAGLPVSAFMMAAPSAASGNQSSAAIVAQPSGNQNLPPASSDVTTTGGAVNIIPMFTTATNIQNSILTQIGTNSSQRQWHTQPSRARNRDNRQGVQLATSGFRGVGVQQYEESRSGSDISVGSRACE